MLALNPEFRKEKKRKYKENEKILEKKLSLGFVTLTSKETSGPIYWFIYN